MSIEYSALNLNATTGFVQVINDDMTVFVSTGGDDDKNTGLSRTSPFATPHRALEYLHDKFITGNAIVTIFCEEGTYTFAKPIRITHPCGERIAIVGEEPSELTLVSVDDYFDTTGFTGSTQTGLAEEGGLIQYPKGCVRTMISSFAGSSAESIPYTSYAGGVDESTSDNAYGERFSMVCTLSGATSGVSVDSYVLVRGFSGGYLSTDSSITGTTVDTDLYTRNDNLIHTLSKGQHVGYPSLIIANPDGSATVHPDQNKNVFKTSIDTPTNRRHNLRYTRWAEPEVFSQRFFAVGCHKVLGRGLNTPGLHTGTGTDGVTGSHLGRFTLENKNGNRNLFKNSTYTNSYIADEEAFDYDRPTPISQKSTQVPQSGQGPNVDDLYLFREPTSLRAGDKIGYDPFALRGIRNPVGPEDSDGVNAAGTSARSASRTHGVFTATNVRTVFQFSKNINMTENQGDIFPSCVVIENGSGLYRLDNLVIRPEEDLSVVPETGDNWGFAPDRDNPTYRRRGFSGLLVKKGTSVQNLGPNVAFTDFTKHSITVDGGHVNAGGIIAQHAHVGVNVINGGDCRLQSATISTNGKANILTENASNCIVEKSIILSSGVNKCYDSSNLKIHDSAILYNCDDYGSNKHVLDVAKSSSLDLERTLIKRCGNINGNAVVLHQHANARFYYCSLEDCGGGGIYTNSSNCTVYYSNIGPLNGVAAFSLFNSQMDFGNVILSGVGALGDNAGGDGFVAAHAGHMQLTRACVNYNQYNGYSYLSYSDGSMDSTTGANMWVWGRYAQNGSAGGDHGGAVGCNSGAFLDIDIMNFGLNDGTPFIGALAGQTIPSSSNSLRGGGIDGIGRVRITKEWTSGRPSDWQAV